MNILFEDNHIIAVFKPSGLPTQKTKGHFLSLEEDVKQFIKVRDQKPHDVFLHAIHRLDKGISGIVLFAKTSKALSRLNEAMRQGHIKKTYTALLENPPPEAQGTLTHFLQHGPFKALVSATEKTHYKLAILHYKMIDHFVTIELVTGRYHQIRAQFAFLGCPICGDVKYGAKPQGNIKLVHHLLSFTHPVTKKPVIIELPREEWFS